MIGNQAKRHAARSLRSAGAMGTIDLASVLAGAMGGAGFFLLGAACLALARFDAILATVWLPNACAVALLLIARVRSEVPLYMAFLFAGIAANVSAGTPVSTAAVFAFANIINIALVTTLTRRACGTRPDMANLSDLGWFLQYGGILGPIVSAVIAGFALAASDQPVWLGVVSWFLADSVGMILVVPTALLIADALRSRTTPKPAEVLEHAALILGGLIAVFLIFAQGAFPLLFLVPPITLLLAFRVGGLGTALFVPLLAIVAGWMTLGGFGPIVSSASSAIDHVFVIQSFVAANFLTGLPIASILAGRTRLTEELALGRGELSLLTETITDAVLRIDKDGLCTYASPSVTEVLGRDPADFIGQTITERVHEDAHDRIVAVLDKLMSGEADKERITYRRLADDDEGSPVFIEADCAIVLDPVSGERSGIVFSARDVTDRVELELLLTQARRKAENAAHAKSEFLANMSHEIRTPMNGVLGFAELMLQGGLDPDARRHTEMIVQSGRSMMLLLNDVLDLSKIESGQIGIDRKPVDLIETVRECARLHRPNAQAKGLSLNLDMPAADGPAGDGDAQPWVLTDGLRLRQILLNLIGNAVKFTEKGRVEIGIETGSDELTVRVTDTGIGISKAHLSSVFAPFTQGESDIARRFGGTGLGLTISRELAELLGGRIDVSSEVGTGSTFRLILPAYYVDPDPQEEPESSAPEPTDLPQGSRILLVEDHDVNRVLVTEMLERCGQRVETAHDGNEAIAMVIDSMMREQPYDLLLMDIQMPDCDGYAATRTIREEGISAADLPIIALTANVYREDIARARKAGMQAHLSKPLNFAELARTLQRWLPVKIVEAGAEEACAALSNPTGASDAPSDIGAEQAATIVDTSRGPERAPQMRKIDSAAPTLSPELIERWIKRRREAIKAVRDALEQGALGMGTMAESARNELTRTVHKLAGTAAIFGEAELGDQAAALEQALKLRLEGEVQAAIATELLSVAEAGADAAGS